MTRRYLSFMLASSLLASAGVTVPVPAQSKLSVPPSFATGITIAAMRYSGGRSDEGLAAALQYSLRPWLIVSAAPGFDHTSLGPTSSSGLTDVPLSAGAFRALRDLPWSPTVSGSLYTTLPLSSGSSTVGLGRSTFGASTALSGWATDRLNVSLGASHPLSAQSGNGSIDVESFYSLGKTMASAGFTTELGRADSGAVLSRSLTAGLAFSVSGPLTLTIGGTHGLTSGAPTWSLSAGFGTAFAGVSPLNPTSQLRGLKRVFGSRVTSTSGYSKSGGATGSCKRSGTC